MKFNDLNEDGKIVKGVNTTADVGTGQTSIEAKKLGFKVNKDGYPPELHSKAKKNSKPNTLYNLGLAEQFLEDIQTPTPAMTQLERACLEGGHAIPENISYTGTATAKRAKKKGLKPGDPEWFKNWFDLPYFMKEDAQVLITENPALLRAIGWLADKGYKVGKTAYDIIKTAPPGSITPDNLLKLAVGGKVAWDKATGQHTNKKPTTEETDDIITRAEQFAQQAHANHKRKYTGLPYYTHLDEVRNIVKSAGGNANMQAAALLHDTIEDTPTTEQDILDEFGPAIAKLVVELTDVSKPEDGNRATRKAIDRDKLAGVSADAQTIKYADLISNGKDIAKNDPKFARVYHKEKADLLRVMTKGNKRLYQQAYDLLPDELKEDMRLKDMPPPRSDYMANPPLFSPQTFDRYKDDMTSAAQAIQKYGTWATKPIWNKVKAMPNNTLQRIDVRNAIEYFQSLPKKAQDMLAKGKFPYDYIPEWVCGKCNAEPCTCDQVDELLGFVPRRSKRATIKKKPEKFEPSVQDKIRARRAAAAKGKKDAWKADKEQYNEETINVKGVLNKDLQQLDSVFDKAGFELRMVGGAVRDLVIGKTPKDIDLATDATPNEMERLFDKAGIKHKPTGIEHGTITAIMNGVPYEVTTLRADVETDGRRAEVKFVRSWEEDAKRRDLTYNAMSMDFDGNLYDYHGGMDDLQNKVTKFVGDPAERIKEDYLRILRYFRFQGRLNNPSFDKATVDAIAKNKEGLSKVSVERVWQEMSKILSGSNVAKVLGTMNSTGVVDKIQLPIVANLRALVDNQDALVNLARLVNDSSIAKRWKMSNEEQNLLDFLITYKNKNLDRSLVQGLLADGVSRNHISKLAMLQGKTDLDLLIKRFDPKFPVSGDDLIAKGMKPGPELGKELSALRNKWKQSNFKATKDDLLGESIKSFTNPNFEVEWDEAKRYPEFVKIGKVKWIELAKKGKPIDVDNALANKIENTEAGEENRHEFDNLEEPKKERFRKAVKAGTVELPIIARYSDGYLELVAGNTRLTGMMREFGAGKAWIFDVPDEIAVLGEEGPFGVLARKAGHAVFKSQYKKAAEFLHKILTRKYKETGGHLRHTLGYYAMMIATQTGMKLNWRELQAEYLATYGNEFFEDELKESANFPTISVDDLYHVGTMDASKKGDFSFEGNGLSVSTHPDAWKRIGRGQVSGDTYTATKPDNQFLDSHKLTKKHEQDITQWAIQKGLLNQQETVTVSWYDDEMDDTLSMTFNSMADAKAEYGDELEDYDVDVDKGGIVPTDKLKKATGQSRIDATGVLDYVLPLYAEQLDLDGVWWGDELDVHRYSAPRGVIVPNKIDTWKFAKERVDKNEKTKFVPNEQHSRRKSQALHR